MSHVWIILPNAMIGNEKFLVFEDSYRSRDIFADCVRQTYAKCSEIKITWDLMETDRLKATVYSPPLKGDPDSCGVTDVIVARRHEVKTMPEHL